MSDSSTNEKRKAKRRQRREALLDNIRTVMSIEAACSLSGIGKTTYYRWLENSPQELAIVSTTFISVSS